MPRGDIGQIEPLVENIYDAAVDRSRWSFVLGRMAAQFGSASAHLSFENVQSTRGSMISHGADPSFAASYSEYYVTRNVLWQEILRRRLVGVACDRQIMPKQELRKSEFYNDFLAPQDCDDLLCAPFFREAESGSTITLWRPRRFERWQRADLERFRKLIPHLSRAVRIANHFTAEEAINTFSAEALYRLERGLFIVSASAVLLFANNIAENLLRVADGLCLHQGRLSARQPEQRESLHKLIAAAAQRRVGGTLAVTRQASVPLLVMVIPLRAETWRAIGGQSGAMVLTKDLSQASSGLLEAFGRHYRLTPAETRMANELLVGDGVLAAAARLKISESTARTHRIRIFQKTGVRRQAELVRLILEWCNGASGAV